MMHPCSQGHVMGTCTCGMFHNNNQMQLFSMPNHYENHSYDQYSSSSYSSAIVDCTLSLGTPSTRFTEDEDKRTRQERRSSAITNFSWKSSSHSQSKPNRGTTNNNDSLLARRCANCDTTSTPLWRNGPRGPKSLCNACGIRYKKEERRANAAAATSTVTTGGVIDSGFIYGQQNNSSWYAEAQSQKYGNELCFMEDSSGDSENGIPFLSWRLNVADRTNLVHDFTRY